MATLSVDTRGPAATQPTPETTPDVLAFLRSYPGVNVRHSGTTLVGHLDGVRQKLEEWQCRPAVCLAGLFHSVYGTEFFRRQTIPIAERPLVRDVIGEEAEELAYQFCTLQTKAFVDEVGRFATRSAQGDPGGMASSLSPVSLDLLHVFVANWLEQLPRTRADRRTTYAGFLKAVRPLLLPLAAEEVEALYGFDTPLSPKLATTAVPSPGTGPDQRRNLGEIKILDDFVPMYLRHQLSGLVERNIWRYGWKSADTQTGHSLWHSHFAGDNNDGGETDCEFELHDRPLVAPVLELWHLIRDQLAPGHIPVRVYANGHTYGCDGHIHDDSKRPGHFTSLYYAHPEWDPNWAGETLFYDAARSEIVKAVFPKPGRLIHFNGNILHAARSPSRDCAVLRSVIVIKTFCPPAP